jgi:hypothetical protein
MEVNKYKPIKLFNKGRNQEFREELAKLKWEEILAKKNHIDVNWEIFITKFKELEKEFIPIKREMAEKNSQLMRRPERRSHKRMLYQKSCQKVITRKLEKNTT